MGNSTSWNKGLIILDEKKRRTQIASGRNRWKCSFDGGRSAGTEAAELNLKPCLKPGQTGRPVSGVQREINETLKNASRHSRTPVLVRCSHKTRGGSSAINPQEGASNADVGVLNFIPPPSFTVSYVPPWQIRLAEGVRLV